MMIFTYLKIAGALLLAGTLAFFVWNYHHRGAIIEKQKVEIAGLELSMKVAQEAVQAGQEYHQVETKIVTRVIHEYQPIDQAVADNNLPGMADLYRKYGVLYPQGFLAPRGPGGNPGHPVTAASGPGTVH